MAHNLEQVPSLIGFNKRDNYTSEILIGSHDDAGIIYDTTLGYRLRIPEPRS